MLQVVPSLLDAALDDWDAGNPRPGLALRRLAVTGEALPPSTCRRWASFYPDIPLVNMYGPTECSDDVAHAVIRSDDPVHGPRTPIGRATRGSRLYVLDEDLRPALLGAPGELYVGGIVVGKGYLGDARRTAMTFVADPFDPRPGSRMYRTGDVVRRRSDGQLEFCGRSDHQVKIRGRRIELGEIEHTLRSIPGVNAAAVVVLGPPGAHPRLASPEGPPVVRRRRPGKPSWPRRLISTFDRNRGVSSEDDILGTASRPVRLESSSTADPGRDTAVGRALRVSTDGAGDRRCGRAWVPIVGGVPPEGASTARLPAPGCTWATRR